MATGAEESPVSDMDEIGLIFKFDNIEIKVWLKEFGSYMNFNNKCLHRGYKRGSVKTYLSAQLFSAPKGGKRRTVHDSSLVDNIETTLTDGAKNPAGDAGADDRSVKGMDKIVDKMEMTLTDDCAMSTSGNEGAEESPVNDMDEIGLIFKSEDIEKKYA